MRGQKRSKETKEKMKLAWLRRREALATSNK
jgi:hypothetical protein